MRIGARPSSPATAAPAGDRLPAPEVDQRLTRAEAGSAFSLNTTAWEWAPYMQRLKAQIERHISPPAAFYYGTAAWISRVRFRIGPDGRLLEFRLLDHRGVDNLQYVALDAITGAADYEPLPPGFPEPYLEITGNFYFNVIPSDVR
jgi:outer membrane biosynthesis protein TonB